jgi:translocator protein
MATRWLVLGGFLLLCYGAAAAGSLLTSPGLPWLATLNKPSFNPPNWVFGPVWSLLYTLMAIAGWLVYSAEDSPRRTLALAIFATQLALNVAWSGLFFYLRQPGWSLVEILGLLAAIWAFVIAARPVSPTASWLFVPYGLWVAFATALNAALWSLNRVTGDK